MSVSGRSNLVDLEVFLHYERPKAILVSTDGKRDKAKWLPKEAIDCSQVEGREGSWGEISLPQDLAEEKGLV